MSKAVMQIKPQLQKYFSSNLVLGFILFLGIVLRIYDLGKESYWIDEMSTLIEGQERLVTLLTSGRLDQPPAFYILFHFWVQIFGTSEVGTRLFSALIGVGSIALIYLIAKELFGKSIGLISAFLMAISEFQIYFSQMARFYSFFEFATLLSFYFFIISLRSGKLIHVIFYVVTSVIMLYSHAYGVFIVVGQNLFFVLQIKKYRNFIPFWIGSQFLILLAFAPYLLPLILQDGGIKGAASTNIGGTPPVAILDPLRTVYRFLVSPRRDRSWGPIILGYLISGILVIVGIWINANRQKVRNLTSWVRGILTNVDETPDKLSKVTLLFCWLLCPIILPYVVSLAIAPMYADRYTIGASPALYILLAFCIFSVRKLIPLTASIVVLAIVIVPGLSYYYITNVNEQWREAAMYVNENEKPDEMVVFAPNQGIGIEQLTFDWYYKGDLQGCGLSNQVSDSKIISTDLIQCIAGHNRFWVIVRDTPDASEPLKLFFQNYDSTVMHLIDQHRFQAISVYLFELTK